MIEIYKKKSKRISNKLRSLLKMPLKLWIIGKPIWFIRMLNSYKKAETILMGRLIGWERPYWRRKILCRKRRSRIFTSSSRTAWQGNCWTRLAEKWIPSLLIASDSISWMYLVAAISQRYARRPPISETYNHRDQGQKASAKPTKIKPPSETPLRTSWSPTMKTQWTRYTTRISKAPKKKVL